jgi:large subunit ribosomal protein L25
MADTKLDAALRSEQGSRPAGRLRREGQLPGIVYGLDTDAVSVTVNAHQLGSILSSKTGANTLISLQLDGRTELALARQVQRDPVKGTLIHVDFVRVRADQTIQAEVRLNLSGQPEGVSQGGMLEQVLHSLTVEGLPGQLPNEIEHDVSALDLGDQLRVGDVQLPAGVNVTNDVDELVAMISVPRGLAEGEGEVAPAEGEEGAEGAAEGGGEEGAGSTEDSGSSE